MPDILIRGMEMPKEGEKILIATDGSVWVNAWPTRGYMRMENVYAIPLPEGHGRLIDGDAVIKEAYRILQECEKHGNEFQKPYEVLRAIETAKTIVPAEGGTEECSEN